MSRVEQSELGAAKDRLESLLPLLSHIRKTTTTPSVSIGVIHRGCQIFSHHEGVKDVSADPQEPVDSDTVYLLGSLTKAFVSASCGILVDEGKLSWDELISSHIPFQQTKDPVISRRATLRDALSHSTGFPQIDISWYGAQGESIVPPEDLVHIVNHIPVFPDFRAKFHYSNWLYALTGRIIETVGGQDAASGWGGFVRRRIFSPLVPDFSDKTITGASAAIWSTVPDMLKWSMAILGRLKLECGVGSDDGNPLRHVREILAHRFRVTDNTINENSYGLGWTRHIIPSTHLGWLSTNGPQAEHVIGKDSRPRLCFYHGGQITGYLNTVYLFPETDSAVVVLTNAQGSGDCSDWVAQAIIQELFDIQPRLNFETIVEQSAVKHFKGYQKMKDEYESHRQPDTPAPDATQLLGSYYNPDIKMTVDVDENDGHLMMQFNGRSSQRHKLEHYHDDVFGFLPASRNEQQLRCLVDYFVYEQFLISFTRISTDGPITSLSWKMQEDLPPLVFTKQA